MQTSFLIKKIDQSHTIGKNAHSKMLSLLNWVSASRRLLIYPYLSPSMHLKSKWVKDLNMKSDKLNLVEEEGETDLNTLV